MACNTSLATQLRSQSAAYTDIAATNMRFLTQLLCVYRDSQASTTANTSLSADNVVDTYAGADGTLNVTSASTAALAILACKVGNGKHSISHVATLGLPRIIFSSSFVDLRYKPRHALIISCKQGCYCKLIQKTRICSLLLTELHHIKSQSIAQSLAWKRCYKHCCEQSTSLMMGLACCIPLSRACACFAGR